MKVFSGDKLKRLLAEKEISQNVLAERLGLAASTVSAWVNNKSIPELGNIDKIASILEIDKDSILDEVPNIQHSGNHNHGSAVIVYANSPVTVNVQHESSEIEKKFLDADIPNPLIVQLKLTKVLLDTLSRRATEQQKGVGQYIFDLLNEKNQ